jgi:hypothetical protein
MLPLWFMLDDLIKSFQAYGRSSSFLNLLERNDSLCLSFGVRRKPSESRHQGSHDPCEVGQINRLY